MTKPETSLVMVETVSMYRMRYVVEVPKENPDWALDTVACNEAKEFSQKYLGEISVSHRTISMEEFLAMCDAENSYSYIWPKQMKMETFITPYTENDY